MHACTLRAQAIVQSADIVIQLFQLIPSILYKYTLCQLKKIEFQYQGAVLELVHARLLCACMLQKMPRFKFSRDLVCTNCTRSVPDQLKNLNSNVRGLSNSPCTQGERLRACMQAG